MSPLKQVSNVSSQAGQECHLSSRSAMSPLEQISNVTYHLSVRSAKSPFKKVSNVTSQAGQQCHLSSRSVELVFLTGEQCPPISSFVFMSSLSADFDKNTLKVFCLVHCLKSHFSRLAVSKCSTIYHCHVCDRSQRKSVLNISQTIL